MDYSRLHFSRLYYSCLHSSRLHYWQQRQPSKRCYTPNNEYIQQPLLHIYNIRLYFHKYIQHSLLHIDNIRLYFHKYLQHSLLHHHIPSYKNLNPLDPQLARITSNVVMLLSRGLPCSFIFSNVFVKFSRIFFR